LTVDEERHDALLAASPRLVLVPSGVLSASAVAASSPTLVAAREGGNQKHQEASVTRGEGEHFDHFKEI